MTTAPELPLADATAMTRFHRIFREALDAAPRFVGAAPADDRDRAELVGPTTPTSSGCSTRTTRPKT